jgi:hypothetical protein
MDGLRERLEKVLAEHQRESGLHVVGGRDKLIQRLLKELGSASPAAVSSESNAVEQNGACC